MSMCSDHKYVFINGDFNCRTSRLEDFTILDSFVSDLLDFDDATASFLIRQVYFKTLIFQLNELRQTTKRIIRVIG